MSEKQISEHQSDLKTVRLEISDNLPDAERINRLQTIPIEKKRATEREKKEAFKWMAVAVVVAIICWIFGKWVIREFVGLGVLVFGYLPAYAGPPVMLLFFLSQAYLLVRSEQKKTPEEAFSWLWETAYFGEDAPLESRFDALDYAVGAAMRAIPDGLNIPEVSVRAYIEDFRNTLNSALDDAKSSDVSLDCYVDKPPISLKRKAITNLADGVVVLEETISGTDIWKWTHENKTYQIAASKFELQVRQVFIRSGDYWFAADPLPKIKRVA
jgi:hypothetical protein